MASNRPTSKLAHGLAVMIAFIALLITGFLLSLSVKFYREIYPDIYSRAILGRAESDEHMALLENWLLIFREAWPVIIVITLLSIVLLVAIFALFQSVLSIMRKKSGGPQGS